MNCAVPGCDYSSSDCSFVQLPKSSILRDRWVQAVQLGSGLQMDCSATLGATAVCTRHFLDQTLTTYQEPSLFCDPNGKFAEISSCRICLKFYHSREMISTDKKFRKKTISIIIQQILGITLTAGNFLHKICEECLIKLDICLRWINDTKDANIQFQELETVIQTEDFCIQESSPKNIEYDRSDLVKQDFCVDEFIETISQQETCLVFEVDLELKSEDGLQPAASCKSMEFIDVDTAVNDLKENESIQGKRSRTRTRPAPESENNRTEESIKRKPGRPRTRPLPQSKNETEEPTKRKGRRPQKNPSHEKPKQGYKAILARKCYVCNTLLESHAELIGHLTTDHAAKIDYICQECDGKTFNRVTAYNHHLSFHDLEFRPMKCSYCKVGFSTVLSLKVHQNREHGTTHKILRTKRIKEKIHQCDSCGKIFRNKYQLREHDEYYHQKIYNSVCTVCNKAFPTKSLLQKHYIVHSGEKPYKCEWCDETYKNSTCLVMHALKHKKDSSKVKQPVKG